MSVLNGAIKMFNPLNGAKPVTVNGHRYVPDGRGELEHVLSADVSAMQAQGFTSADPRDTIRNSPHADFGRG